MSRAASKDNPTRLLLQTARKLYGTSNEELMDNAKQFAYYPVAMLKNVDNFSNELPMVRITVFVAVFPMWLATVSLLTLSTILSLFYLRRRRRWHRLRHQICVHCGYDLRATPFRCPECGKSMMIATEETGVKG